MIFGFSRESGRIAKIIEHATGSHGGLLVNGIDIKYLAEVLGPVHGNRCVTALPSKAGAAASRKEWHVELPARSNGFDFIINRFRYDNTDWDLAIVRGINRVKRLGSCIEAVSSGVMARRAFI